MTKFIVIERHTDPYALLDGEEVVDVATRGLPLFDTKEDAAEWLDKQFCLGLLPKVPEGWGYGPATSNDSHWFAMGRIDDPNNWDAFIRYDIATVEIP